MAEDSHISWDWGQLAQLAGQLYGSYAQSQGGKKSADAQVAGSQAAINESRRQFDTILNMLAPQRQLGNSAINSLNRLYGYGGVQPSGSSIGSTGIGVNSAGGITQGVQTGGSAPKTPNRYFGKPVVDANGQLIPMPANMEQDFVNSLNTRGKYAAAGAGLSQEERNYLGAYNDAYRTPSGTSQIAGGILDVAGAVNPYFGLIKAGSDASNASAPSGFAGDPSANYGAYTDLGMSSTVGTGQPDMSVFFNSPDYQFRRSEGDRDIGNSFAATGSGRSGNALRALTDYNSNLASGEYANFINRLMAQAGLGQTATNNAVSSAQYTGANVGNYLNQQGQSRASGIQDQTNALTGGISDLLSWFAKNKNQGGGSTPNYGSGYDWSKYPGG